jgi:hypothetical protein
VPKPSPADGEPIPADSPADGEPTPPSPSSRERPASSKGSSAAADAFFADPGPPFDPDVAADPDEELGEPPPDVELVLWTPERIRRVLELQGQATHHFVGVAERDWLWLPHELDMVCGPLADHCNRVPALAALAHLSDDAAIAAGFVSYAARSWLERTRELQARAGDSKPQPVTGRSPEPADTPPAEEVPWVPPTT